MSQARCSHCSLLSRGVGGLTALLDRVCCHCAFDTTGRVVDELDKVALGSEKMTGRWRRRGEAQRRARTAGNVTTPDKGRGE
eukprot:711943-Hanusia_phi.AAC.1